MTSQAVGALISASSGATMALSARRMTPTPAELSEKLEWTLDRTAYVAQVVADARRRYDDELLAFIDPEAIDLDADDEDERTQLDG